MLIENNSTVVLADDFFVKASIRIIRKNRNRPIQRSLVSERDTSQENFTDETTKFHFKTSFEETTSVSLATSQGFSANIGGGLSGGAVGASLGLSSGLEYSKSKSFGQDKSRAQNKELTAEVDVKKHTRVIVKELTYEVEWAAVCDLELMLRNEDKIEYKCTGRWGKERYKCVEVKKLLKKLIAREKKEASSSSSALETSSLSSTLRPSLKSEISLTGSQLVFSFIEHAESSSTPAPNAKSDQKSTIGNQVYLTENLLVIEFSSDCLFNAEEHKLEIIELPSDPERIERIFDHQLGEEHHEDDRLQFQ